MGGVGIILFLLVAAGAVLWVEALADAMGRPASRRERAEQNQFLWVGVIIFANIIGALLYWAVGRPQLMAHRPRESMPLSG